MIFMSQSGLTDLHRQSEWECWYAEHLRIMRTVPGISSAQRFTTDTIGNPPSLAMYSVVSETVFRDPYYLSVRGMGDWTPLIDLRFYRRNLFAGLREAPLVPRGSLLIVVDRTEPEPAFHSMTWLKSVGLDNSTPYRGISTVDANRRAEFEGIGAGIYAPVEP